MFKTDWADVAVKDWCRVASDGCFKKRVCSCITSSIICTYCDVRPQHFTCQNLCNVSTFLLDIGETQLLHWCCLCNNLMGALIYRRTSLYKLILQQSLNSNLVCLWNTFCTGAHHYLGQGFRTVSACFLVFFLQPYQRTQTHTHVVVAACFLFHLSPSIRVRLG